MSIENLTWFATGTGVGCVVAPILFFFIERNRRLSRLLIRIGRALRPTMEPGDNKANTCLLCGLDTIAETRAE